MSAATWKRIVWGLPVPLAFLGLWYLAVDVNWEPVRLVPQLDVVGRQMWDFAFGGIIDDVFSGTLSVHLWASAQRVLTGFAYATLVAVPLGIVMGRFGRVSSMVDLTVSLMRPIPVTAWVPLVLLVFGLGRRRR